MHETGRTPDRRAAFVAAFVLLISTGAPLAGDEGDVRDTLHAAVASEGRPATDVARDADRKPGEVLEFLGIDRGMRVADLMASRGYYTEILADVVGSEGHVYAHNNSFVLDRFAREPLKERLVRLGRGNVTMIEAGMNDPQLPRELDAAILIRFYHDFYWQGVDRAAFNDAVFEALVPGGVYGVLDHHAEAGSRDRDVQSFHRVDVEMVKEEILAAGFVLDGESNLLRDADDTRDWNIFKERGAYRDKTDRFLLRFKKPE